MTDEQWAHLRPLSQAAADALAASDYAVMMAMPSAPNLPADQLMEFGRLALEYTAAERAYQAAWTRIRGA